MTSGGIVSEPQPPPLRILVVDDEEAIRQLLRMSIEELGFAVTTAGDGESAIARACEEQFDLALVDLQMPKMDGLELLSALKRLDESISVIIMTGFGTIERAIDAMKKGAEEFLLKPVSLEAVGLIVERIRERRRLREEHAQLREQLAAVDGERRIITRSRKMQKVLGVVTKIAPLPATVLIQGESGTGKELIARAIHNLGPRSTKRFVALNCAALPPQLLESELFGYERGAFTGANARKAGYFEVADGGTIFLDEITEMGVDLQAKLLRVLQERRFQRVGGTTEVETSARVVASTNREMAEEVASGRFRKDLFYRLNVVSISVPPLRERREDILLLGYYFLGKYRAEFNKRVDSIDPRAAEILHSCDWEGNVRQLENAIERAVAVAEGVAISVSDLPPELKAERSPEKTVSTMKPYQDARREFEEGYLKAALENAGGNLAKAARMTGIPRQYLYEKLEKLGIDRGAFR